VGDPHAVFLLLGNYLWNKRIIRCSPEVFAHARVNAETAAHNKPNLPVVNLVQIYKELQYMLKISPETSQFILELECQLESKLLTPLPGAKEKVKKSFSSGQKIVLISDMYLPSKFINEQLRKNGFPVNNNCYVSNEYLKSKRTGELFKVVAKDCGLPPSHFTHFGDNKKSDFDAPKKLNWNAVHYTKSKLNRYEVLLNSFMWETGGLSSIMAGASRIARLNAPGTSQKESEIRKISAGVVGPVLVSYVLWILNRAREMNLKRLYFVSRDGQIYLKIAKILVKKLNLDIEVRYLYGSRKAWHFPSITYLPEEIDWIVRKVETLTVRIILDRVFTQPEEIKEILEENGFPPGTWDKDLHKTEISILKDVLLQKKVEKIIIEKARSKRELAYKYFKQEDLTQDNEWALVDIGWGGNSQNFMGKILKLYGASLPKGFYFALKAKEIGETHGLKEGYLVDKIINVGYAKLLDNIQSLMESFCTADHGTVESYEEKENKAIPVFSTLKNEKVVEWELKTIQDTVCKFTESLFLDENFIDPYVHLRPVIAKLIETFGRKPTKEEAVAWGSFQLEENAFEIRFLPLAQPYQLYHLYNIFKNGDPLQHKLSWMEGAMAMTPRYMQKIVIFTAKAGRFLRKSMGKRISRTKF
jgi:FMN phosphatase YigB (HAD superfamily)